MRKLTYHEVKNYIESFEGYKLLSKEYKNSSTKVKIRCPLNHLFWIPVPQFKQGQRCDLCANNQRLTYSYVKDVITGEGYELLSKDYKNNHTKLKMKCPDGHIFYVNYNNFKNGSRCPICYGKTIGDNLRFSHQEVKDYIESFEGYKLISKKYKNANDKLQLKCSNGHIFWITYGHFKNGIRCSICSGMARPRLEYCKVKDYIKSEGYKLLSKDYKNYNTKLKMKCLDDHVFFMSFKCFKRGYRCLECSGKKKTTNQKFIDEMKFCESIRETKDEKIEVKCTYCGVWYHPTRKSLNSRLRYIINDNYSDGSEYRLYCSDQCKQECPTYGQQLYPKGHKTTTSREVQPELRQMVLNRDNYTCQKCKKHKDTLDVGLHCHHIWPLNESPVTSADIDECITYCVDCHVEVHKTVPGCGYGESRCSIDDEVLV